MSSRTVVALVVDETEHHLDLPVWCQFYIEFPVNVLYVNVTARKQSILRTERGPTDAPAGQREAQRMPAGSMFS